MIGMNVARGLYSASCCKSPPPICTYFFEEKVEGGSGLRIMGALAPVGPLPEPPLEERELKDKMR